MTSPEFSTPPVSIVLGSTIDPTYSDVEDDERLELDMRVLGDFSSPFRGRELPVDGRLLSGRVPIEIKRVFVRRLCYN